MIDKSFYDQGWDAYVRGEPYTELSMLSWRDGWKDAKEAGTTMEMPPLPPNTF